MPSASESAYLKYVRLIQYVAQSCHSMLPVLDIDDLVQEGSLLLVEIWGSRGISEDERERLFKNRLLSRMMNRTRSELVRRRTENDYKVRIDLDVLDCRILASVYARELIAETRRLLQGQDRIIFDYMIGRRTLPQDRHVSSNVNGQWSRHVARELGLPRDCLWRHVREIRKVALNLCGTAA